MSNNKKKITTFRVDTFLNILGFIHDFTHKRNIAYNLQYLDYINQLKRDHIDIGETSLAKSFRKNEIIIILSIIECVLYDLILFRDLNKLLIKIKRWKDTGEKKDFIIKKDEERIRTVRQIKKEIEIDKFTIMRDLIEISEKNKLIDENILEEIKDVKKLRDFIHIKGLYELEYEIFNAGELKKAKNTLLNLIKFLSHPDKESDIDNYLYFLK